MLLTFFALALRHLAPRYVYECLVFSRREEGSSKHCVLFRPVQLLLDTSTASGAGLMPESLVWGAILSPGHLVMHWSGQSRFQPSAGRRVAGLCHDCNSPDRVLQRGKTCWIADSQGRWILDGRLYIHSKRAKALHTRAHV